MSGVQIRPTVSGSPRTAAQKESKLGDTLQRENKEGKCGGEELKQQHSPELSFSKYRMCE